VTHGTVVGLQPRIEVIFRLPNRPDLKIEFVLDTGFEGGLTLTPSAVAALGLPPYSQLSAKLADGSNVTVDVHTADIIWDGQVIQVAVLAMSGRPLLGTALLSGFNLNVDFVDGGTLVLSRLPP
jgi:clan AA aspartic protease